MGTGVEFDVATGETLQSFPLIEGVAEGLQKHLPELFVACGLDTTTQSPVVRLYTGDKCFTYGT